MDLKEIAKNYDKNKKQMMIDAVEKNRNHMKNFPNYNANSLSLMYAEWHILFPAQKQDINCSSCRKAVNKFWETMVDEWKITKEVKKTKTIGTKKRKTK
tara:strand:- start:1378 stop:1674 length:297 start_codon:yes stop_codon:yes gene_type:complete